MVSIRNSTQDIEARILDAAAACLLSYGVERTTLTEIARRARVSRPTIYRRWSDIREVIAELMTRRIAGVFGAVDDAGVGRQALVARVIAVAAHLRSDAVIMAVIHDAPDIASTYITGRLGTSQQILLDALADAIAAGQNEGSIRAGNVHQMAAMCLLITQSTVQSAQMVAELLDPETLDAELGHALNGYLQP